MGDLKVQPETVIGTDLPEGYRETELGPLPEEWDIVRLEEIATIVMGQSPPSETYNPDRNGLPFLQGKAEFGDVYPQPVKWCSSPLKISPEGAVLISVRAPVGDVNIAPYECCIGRGLAAIQPGSNADTNYLFYYFGFHKSRFEEQSSGSTFRSINKGVLQNFLTPVPPLLEQEAIAQVLRTVQKAIETTEQVIESTRELKRSLMNHLFTYGLVPVDEAEQVPLKETEIGLVSEEWKLCDLEDLKAADKRAIVSGPFGSNIGKRFFVEEGIPVIRGNNLTKGRVQFLDEGFVFVTEEKAQELSGCIALPGDLVFTAAGTIGQVGVIPDDRLYEKYIISNKQMRVRIDPSRVLPMYLFYWFAHDRMQNLIAKRRRGSSIPVINLGILRKLPVGLPDLAVQEQIVRSLAAMDHKISIEANRKQTLEILFKTLLHNLMTGRMRVKDLDLSEVEEVV